jgi:hypothetical protein
MLKTMCEGDTLQNVYDPFLESFEVESNRNQVITSNQEQGEKITWNMKNQYVENYGLIISSK